MYCRHCGQEMNEGAAVCTKCGMAKNTPVTKERAFCFNCGEELDSHQAICVKCGFAQQGNNTSFFGSSGVMGNPVAGQRFHRSARNKILAGVCGGLGEMANCNPWIFRAILIITNFMVVGWLLDIAYIIAVFAVPIEE